MKVLKKSPLLDRDTADEVHNALDEKSHKKAHKGEKASFQTVEEENRFRNFIVKSNPDYATTIGLDPTNEEGAKGVLNNPTIQKAFKEFGKDYAGFLMEETKYVMQEATVKLMEKADVVYGEEQALATAEFRDVTEPFGFDKEGNPFYFDYDTCRHLASKGRIKKDVEKFIGSRRNRIFCL